MKKKIITSPGADVACPTCFGFSLEVNVSERKQQKQPQQPESDPREFSG